MDIVLKNLQTKATLNSPQILKVAKMILRHEGVQQAFLSIVFVSNQKIKSLNKKYLSRDYATDVLAFDSNDQVRTKTSARRKPRSVSGDVIISTDAAKKNARLYGVSPSQELADRKSVV